MSIDNDRNVSSTRNKSLDRSPISIHERICDVFYNVVKLVVIPVPIPSAWLLILIANAIERLPSVDGREVASP